MVASYNGWTASPDPKAIGINREWEPIPGHRFPGGVKAGDVETVLTWVVQQLDKRVEPIDRDAIKDEWGWYYKQSANSPDLVSCHSSGTAFDYNATRHPNGVRGTFTPPQVLEIGRILAEVQVVRWLGDATRTADEMHFEIRGTTAAVAAAAKRIRSDTNTPHPAPAPEEPDVDMELTWVQNPKDGKSHLYLAFGNTATHVANSDGTNVAAFRGARKTNTKDKPQGAGYIAQMCFLDGPLKGL